MGTIRGAPTKGLAAAAIAGIAIVPFLGQPASAATAPHLKVAKVLSTAYIGPLQFAVDGNRILVADSFTSTLNQIGVPTPLATNPGQGNDIAGVAIDHRSHAYAYTSSNADHSTTTLTIRAPHHRTIVADLSGYERTKNPDQHVTYGVDHPANQCVKDAFTFPPSPEEPAVTPATYKGRVDSHPYAVASLGDGAWAVADAGGNDIVRVNRQGHVSLIGLLPRQPVTFTAESAAANHLPACVIGVTYNSEPVPTDVEVGPHGRLYVSTLSGGFGSGTVYRMDRDGDERQRLVTGLVGATNVAVGPHGGVYVAELFAGVIAEVSHGVAVPKLALPGVAAIEFSRGHLYASTAPAALLNGPPTGPPPAGSIVRLSFT